VICQSNLRQIGTGLQMYLDEQKVPVYPNVRNFVPPSQTKPIAQIQYHVGIVDVLAPYLSNSQQVFLCPGAKGRSSVRDPYQISYARTGSMWFTLPTPPATQDAPVTKYTEYWFNPSAIFTGTIPSGVSGRRIQQIPHLDTTVFSMDALDWAPRHAMTGSKWKQAGDDDLTGASNILFGDQSVKLLDYVSYYETDDKYGAPAPFYNWGHYYPNKK
jgi:hypothetical protein